MGAPPHNVPAHWICTVNVCTPASLSSRVLFECLKKAGIFQAAVLRSAFKSRNAGHT